MVPLSAICLAFALIGDAWSAGVGIPLDRQLVPSDIDIAPGDAAAVSGPVAITSRWRLVSTVNGVRTWEARSPVRPRTLFFNNPPDDMRMMQREEGAEDWSSAEVVRHAKGIRNASRSNSWSFSTRGVQVRRLALAGPPVPGEYGVRYTRASTRENSLSYQASGLGEMDFLVRSLQVDDTTRHGLFLPAPSSVTYDLTVPVDAVLDFDARVIPPEARDPVLASDGARLQVLVKHEQTEAVVFDEAISLDEMEPHRVDLGEYGGKTIQLTVRSDPDGGSEFDYLFVADPVVFVPEENPRRVFMIFIDTLRQDHLGMYGYERDTTPFLDSLATDGAVFEQARSVAPWTLPSTRSVLLGDQPEAWGLIPTLQERFGNEGWATAFLAGNVYLSSNFEIADNWGTHRCINWPLAEVQVDRALSVLDRYDDRSTFMMLHFMDMHLPYTEPFSYRNLFAGEAPKSLPDYQFLLNEVRRAAKNLGPEGKQYVQDRYDNNLRYIDDQLARVLGSLSDDDVLVLFSDHGEEFWDHGGFEHGHTLFDELLRVPLVIRGPGIQAGRFDAPVSLVDVAPSVARAVGLSSAGMTGWALQDLADGSKKDDFVGRPIAFGRPLYGHRRWGTLSGNKKYTTMAGRETLFDLQSDAAEKKALSVGPEEYDRWRSILGEALGRDSGLALRFVPNKSTSGGDLVVEVHVPGGVAHGFAAEDPTKKSHAEVTTSGETATIRWKSGYSGVREVFVVPEENIADILGDVRIVAKAGGKRIEWGGNPELAGRRSFGKGKSLTKVKVGKRSVSMGFGVAPRPLEGAADLSGFDAEVQAELEALGYLDRE